MASRWETGWICTSGCGHGLDKEGVLPWLMLVGVIQIGGQLERKDDKAYMDVGDMMKLPLHIVTSGSKDDWLHNDDTARKREAESDLHLILQRLVCWPFALQSTSFIFSIF